MIHQPATIRPAPDPRWLDRHTEPENWEPLPRWLGHLLQKRSFMPVEIEAKMKVADLSPVRAKLQEFHAELIGDFFEVNTFFDTDDRSLLAADEGLRLRVARDVSSTTRPDDVTLTYKGPRRHGALKSRDETELKVSSPQEAAAFLSCLGFTRIMSFEKRRQSWKIDTCRVELDEIPHLGVYIEIEGTSDVEVMKCRETLGLSGRPIVRASYVALLMTYLQEHGQTDRTVKFPATPTPVAKAG